MCLSAYYKLTSTDLEIQTSECYKMFPYVSNKASLELIAHTVAEKINVKVDKSSVQFSQN